MGKKRRLLFILPGPNPPNAQPEKNVFHHLSAFFEGDIVTSWWEKDGQRAAVLKPKIQANLGAFRYNPTRSTHLPAAIRMVWDFAYFVGKGIQLARREGRYDAIVAYGVYKTAIAGAIIRAVTGGRLILDVSGNPRRGFAFESAAIDRLKGAFGQIVAPWVIHRADALKLLYPSQLGSWTGGPGQIVRVFHNFVPVSAIKGAEIDERYILFIGHPWRLKGVDVLIRAFKLIADRHPGVHLKIMGHCPDRTFFEQLRDGDERIEFLKAAPNDVAMERMARCEIFVLPSRTEAMGRVLLEAMAACKPVIASAVDGIPHYVEHDRTGLLFQSEDHEELAGHLDRLLSDSEFAASIAAAGHERVTKHLAEEQYLEQFVELVEATIARDKG